MIVVVCPGQGSQTPGFLSPWLEVPSFAVALDGMQQASGIDLIAHGTVSDADAIRDTAVAQPLIVAAGVASLASVLDGNPELHAAISGVAGHSVGEITAAIAAGIFKPETGINFVRERGLAMAKSAAEAQTSMAAVLGGDQTDVVAHLASLELDPANYNGGGQIVAAGSATGIAQLQADPPAGARVIPLQVAGAFHTRFMSSAVERLANYASSVEVADPTTAIWSNRDGNLVTSGSEFVELLINQVKSPVRWDLCMASMVEAGVTAILEVSPAGTLVGLAKRSMPGVETLALKTPDQLEAAQTLIRNHSN